MEKDPWVARDDYIAVILDRHSETRERFFKQHARRELSAGDQVTTLRLLELQRHTMLMYTSCGWFSDELSGLETVQIMQYAARAIQLASDLLAEDFECGFLNQLERAKSNLREHRDGRAVYQKMVKPALMTREKVAAHYAVSSLFENFAEQARIYSFTVTQEDRRLLTAGNARLALGRIKVMFEITLNSDTITYVVLHLGDHNLNCGVRFYQGPEAYTRLLNELQDAFRRADFPAIIRLMDHHFGVSNYSFDHLFRDEQSKVLNQILASTCGDLAYTYRLITDRYTPLLRFLATVGAPAPKSLELAMEIVLNHELCRQFESDHMDLARVHCLLKGCEICHTTLDMDTLGYLLKGHFERLSEIWAKTPEDLVMLQRFEEAAALIRTLPFEVNLWKTQNVYYNLLQHFKSKMDLNAKEGNPEAQTWMHHFRALGGHLGFRVE